MQKHGCERGFLRVGRAGRGARIVVEIRFKKIGRRASFCKTRMTQDTRKERFIGGHSEQLALFNRPGKLAARFVSRFAVHDEFGEHRIIMRGNKLTCVNPRVHA